VVHVHEGRLGEGGPEVLVSRTGYSGELGYEVWCHPDDGPAVFDTVYEAGSDNGIALFGSTPSTSSGSRPG